MLLAIDKIPGYIFKSWKDSSNLKATTFNRRNIVFGYNGAGKSSLAKGIAETYAKINDVKTARIFDDNYIDDTLLLEDKKGIRGVVSNFGVKDVTITQKINKNNEEIKSITKQIEEFGAAKVMLGEETDALIKEIVKRRKGKNKKVNNKPDGKTISEKMLLWVKDYEDAHRQFPDEDYNAITGDADFSVESDQIASIVIPQIPSIDDGYIDHISKVFATEYKSIEIPDTEIINWLQAGLHIHEDKEKCEFCGGDLHIEVIKAKINSFVNNEKHRATVEIETFRNSLNAIVETIEVLLTNKDIYSKTLELDADDIKFEELSLFSQHISSLINTSVAQKLSRMSITFVIDVVALTTGIGLIKTSISDLNDIKKQRSQKVIEKINRLEILVKGAIGFEIQGSQVIKDKLSEIAKNEDTQSASKTIRDNLTAENALMEAQKSDLADFAIYLNDVLYDLSLNFKLELSNNAYVLKHLDGSILKVSDISDGEKNLLALIYFYFEMLQDSGGAVKDIIRLIIIDDPITSLDDNNKYYITTLLRSILECKTAQVFVLTHSWDDFCNLAYGYKDENTSLFEIRKSNGISNIHVIGGNKLLKPYVQLYREIDHFRNMDVENISDEEALHMPNTMRRVLEEYLKFTVDIDFATACNTGDISKALFKREISELSKTKQQKLTQLLSICNILSHKTVQPKNPSEIHESAKFLINTIEQYDKYHHLKMRDGG